MLVKELIEELQRLDQDAEVRYSHHSGDYWGTELAYEIDRISEEVSEKCDYHNGEKIIEDPYDERYEGKDLKEFVLLS